MRSLASIKVIDRVDPISNADNIEQVSIGGWICVVKKDENLKPGDLCVYIEIDSVVKERPCFEFLRDRKFRIKSIKLRGVCSQGLALPLSYFPEINPLKVKEDDDVTELLGVTKYDPEAIKERRGARVNTKPNPIREFFMQFAWFRKLHRYLYPGAKRGFPSFIRKTDETRIQNYGAVLTAHKDKDYYVSEKIDGQNGNYFVTYQKTLFGKKPLFGVCSRNLYLKTRHSCNWWNVADKFDIEKKLLKVGKDICIQGEILGPSIQGNKYGLSDLDFYVFNVWDIETQTYYAYEDLVGFCKEYGFKTVPIISDYVKLPETLQEIITMADGTSVLKNVLREGLVFRTVKNLPNGEPVSFKAVSNKFLLKNQDADEAAAEQEAELE